MSEPVSPVDQDAKRRASLPPLPGAKEPAATADKSSKSGRGFRFAFGIVLLGVTLFFTFRYLADDWVRETTDDAFVDGKVSSVASKVAGQVLAVHVAENQNVKIGDLLVELDPRDYETKLAQKRAALESTRAYRGALEAAFDLVRARVNTAEATVKQTQAEEAASRSSFENADANWNRAQLIWTNSAHRVISDQDYDAAKAAMTTAKANWQAAVEKAAVDASKVLESRAEVTAAEKLYEQAGAQVGQSEADVRAAELDLSYTKIAAPVEGRVTRKMVEQGAYIQVAQNLLAIVRPDIWVTANFKETQIAKIHPGLPVVIKLDALAGRTFRGHVDSLQSGSGARFSLLPPENAVGNYVKVVQRVPVKIVFDEPLTAAEGLGPGMSAEPSVQTGNRSISDALIALAAAAVAGVAGFVIWLVFRRRSTD